jgi:hypothetical protein
VDWIDTIAGAYTPGEWQAIAAVGTFVVAVAAAVFAFFQVREAARIRVEQARPYVVAFVDRSSPSDVDLVVKNFGVTAARGVELVWDRPPLIRWGDVSESFESFEQLPLLVPGQEWRSIWDFNGKRIDDDEPAYSVTVRSHDARGRRLRDETFVLDTKHFAHEMMWQRKTLHDVGNSLEKIERRIGRWGDGISGLKVFTRDGDEEDARQRANMNARLARRSAADDGSSVDE